MQEMAEVVPLGAEYGSAYHDRIEERLDRIEQAVDRLRKTVEVYDERAKRFDAEIGWERLNALHVEDVQQWREQVSAWIEASHEQVELHATMLLGLAGVTAIARRPALPEPPAWPSHHES